MTIVDSADGVAIEVRVQPGAKRSAILGEYAGAIKIALNAPPVDGKANDALIAFLSRVLHVRKSQISIVRGEKSRSKTVFVTNLSREDVVKQLTMINS